MSRVRWMTVTTALGVAAAGVLTVTATSPVQANAAAAAPPTTHVRIARNHTVTMPQALRPGLHRFMVGSSRRAAFQLVRPDPGYTKAEAARDANRGVGQGKVKALKRFERHVTLLGGVPSTARKNGVMWAKLHRGTYWALDASAMVVRARHLVTFRVRGAQVPGRISGGPTIRAVNAVHWSARPRVIDRSGRLVFRNRSTANHFVSLAKLRAGKTIADFRAWIAAAQQGQMTPPPINQKISVDSGVLSPGRAMAMRYALPAGNYVLVCWWPDANMGATPHAFMGMYRGIRLR